MNNPLPLCSFRCQDLLVESVWTNNFGSFKDIVDHVKKNALTVNTIELGEKIAESPLPDKPQWLQTLRSIQKHNFSHKILSTAAGNAQRHNDIPTLLFVFNELRDNCNLQRQSVLLEIFPIVQYVRQILCFPTTPEIEKTLPTMLEVCSHAQCRFLVLNCLKDENFTHIDAFAPHIDLTQLGEDIQVHYKNGDQGFEAAVAFFQNRALCSALQTATRNDLSGSLPLKRKI